MSDKVQEVSIRRVPMSFDLAVSIQRVLTGRITFESKFLENAIDDSESSENRMGSLRRISWGSSRISNFNVRDCLSLRSVYIAALTSDNRMMIS